MKRNEMDFSNQKKHGNTGRRRPRVTQRVRRDPRGALSVFAVPSQHADLALASVLSQSRIAVQEKYVPLTAIRSYAIGIDTGGLSPFCYPNVKIGIIMLRTIAILGLVISVSACAQKPEDIQASYISPNTYSNLNCSQLRAEAARVDNAYTRAAAAQTKARSNDTAGVILLGLPVSSLSGANQAAQIGDLKGRQEVLAQTMIEKNC